MPITILCPNGHKLTCPDSLAGKAGKCPHCQAKFKIPAPSVPVAKPEGAAAEAGGGFAIKTGGKPGAKKEPAKPAAAAEEPQTAQPVVEAAPVAVAEPAPPVAVPEPEPAAPAVRSLDAANAADPGDDEIVFMCPEGHHLCGPATLVDQAGECPVCHTRFIVPSPDEAVEDQEPEIQLDQYLAAAEAPQGFSFNGDEGGPRGLGALFAELWKYRARGCAIELHLGEGRVLVPGGFATDSAGLTHGLFTVAEPNGAATLAVIAWNSIERINVRGLFELPRGITFDVPQ